MSERSWKPELTRRQKMGVIRAFWVFMGDRDANKLLRALSVIVPAGYGIFPVDLIPDVLPIIGWTDDAGIFALIVLIAGGVYRSRRAQR